MSQTIVPAAPPGSPAVPSGLDAPATGTLRGRVAATVAALEHAFAGTPGRLRLVSATTVIVTILATILGGAALHQRSSALADASATATHLVLLQRVQTELVQADADATNSFLGFGLEPENQRLDYIAVIKDASAGLAEAAQGSSKDAAALGLANAALTRYTGYVASARANNRQGLPVGASYLETASALLRSDVIPRLKSRSDADTSAINKAYGRAGDARWLLLLAALLGLGVLLGGQLYLVRQSRRFVNVPLVAATAGLLVGLIVAGGVMTLAQSKADDVRTGALARAEGLSRSRVAAFDAKSNESLTLIERGSGTPADPIWAAAANTAVAAIPPSDQTAGGAFANYVTQHQAIRKLDLAGDWGQAVKQATASGKSSANAEFTTYATTTAQHLTTQAKDTTTGLHSARRALPGAEILLVLLGLLAAAGAWWGVSLRLDEYR